MQSHQALRTLLYVLAAVTAIGGLVLAFITGWILAFVPPMPFFPNAAFAVALLKAIGIFALGLSYLLFVTAREPVRYAPIVDAMAFILVGVALLNIYSVIALHLNAIYPSAYFITRAAIQLAFAAALIALRPYSSSASSSDGPGAG